MVPSADGGRKFNDIQNQRCGHNHYAKQCFSRRKKYSAGKMKLRLTGNPVKANAILSV
jgi:hypothetical protein